ncbi:MAG: hypothetical protein EKK41_16090 [Hyphomicrobiales bacterium]|nr:MAG: hypothetical protein EKK41_16090 [Hyphomicrobiales bacterium]
MTELTAVPEDAVLPRLVKLARKGSYGRAATDAYQIMSPRNAFASPIAVIARPVIEAGLAHGWLVVGDDDGHVRLSVEGARRVRRHLSAATSRTPRTAAPSMGSRPTRPAPPSWRARPQRVEGPLAWLRRRKDRDGKPLITEPQFAAGERLAADFARARLEARVTASWSPTAPCHRTEVSGASGADVSDMAIAARDRINRMIKAVGPEIASLLIDVCCHDIGLEVAERARGWPVRSCKVVLDMGLTQLARHYGLLREAADEPRTRARRWSDDAFAPNLDQWL